MKNRSLLLSLVALVALLIVPMAANAQRHTRDNDESFSERDEINQTFTLASGARVEVRGVNGTVDIETGNGATAEVHVVRKARNRDDLNYHKIFVEQTAGGLVVRGEEKNHDSGDHQVRHEVTLRLPRQIELNVSGVNGRATVGAIEGPVTISGINGAVEVAQAVGYANLSGINGRVKVSILRLSERGIHVSGINGGVEMQFAEDLNADVEVTGINGRVNADVPNVTVMGKLERNNFRAKIGAGGTPIIVNGVNGQVKLTRGGFSG
ncbi:MAG TPA: hypothetical protein VJ464_20485 [Blastocatellia bacterium]|nr:hypothetical protein [Blastocatellia bacterium]